MKKYITYLMLLASIVACAQSKTIQPTDLATEAMERARVAEADIYAPAEYGIANALYTQMNEQLNQGKKEEANTTAEKVVNAANAAIRAAHQNKAVMTIADLKDLLKKAQEMGVDQSHPDIYSQANQALINAESSYQNNDYAQAEAHASQGKQLLERLLGGQEALALANLNRARELLSRAYKTTELKFSEETLTQASNEIELSAQAYQNQQYEESLKYSESAIMKIEEMMEKFPNDATVSLKVNAGSENIQLQAYDLLRRLGDTLQYIRENNYTNSVKIQQSVPALPLVPVQPIGTDPVEEHDSKFEPHELSYAPTSFRAQNVLGELNSEDDMFVQDSVTSQDKLPIIVDSQQESKIDGLVIQENAELTAQDETGTELTLEIIENIHNTAQQEYNSGNYLNAADLAREGLRLSELYLAGQTLKIHTVKRGHTLWDIAGETYNSPHRYWLWPNIWRANKLIIKDPDLIYPKQRLRIPPAPQQ